MKVELQPSYILHTRPFRDTSLIVDILARDYGRLSLLARGYRHPRGRQRQALSPFIPWLFSWQGRSELKTLTNAEARHSGASLNGNHLYSALYGNELLMRLLPLHDPHPEIFAGYEALIEALGRRATIEPVLRRFELDLLEQLGYGIAFDVDAASHEPITAGTLYRYLPESGFVAVAESRKDNDCFNGADLIAIRALHFNAPETLRAAKRLLRKALAPHLGDKPLHSRSMFHRSS